LVFGNEAAQGAFPLADVLRDLFQRGERCVEVVDGILKMTVHKKEIDRDKLALDISDLTGRYMHLPIGELEVEKIHFELTTDTSNPSVLADKIQIRRVLENILRNAVEAIKETGKISISTELEDNLVIIKCVDTGIGIPEEIIEQLFTSNITTKKEGTGLGLANVKRIIDDLDGKLKIKSSDGKGTTVTIKLPKCTQLKNEQV